MTRPAPWVAIEVSRQMRLAGGAVADPGALSAAGRNLLEHQIAIARQVTQGDRIVVLSAQSDETLLDIVGNQEVREMAPLEFVQLMRERAAEAAPVVLLRQCVPLRAATDLLRALELLAECEAVVSASVPPAGHSRHQPLPGETEPDYRCLAFEVRRASQFANVLGTEERLLHIDWDSFVEYLQPNDKPEVEQRLKAWW